MVLTDRQSATIKVLIESLEMCVKALEYYHSFDESGLNLARKALSDGKSVFGSLL